jgi:hypothetical protein
MKQTAIDFSFAFDPSAALPVSGKTPRSRHASASGAQRAAIDRGALSVAYLNLLRATGPLSDHAAAKALGRETSSINSTRNGLGDLVIDSGEYEQTAFGTKRTKWQAR